VIADEIAYWPIDESSAEPDSEIINALRPGMATIPGALLLAASSPYARRGELRRQHRAYYGQQTPILVWQAATRVMKPTVPQRVIDSATERDPASAAAEYGAQFRSDVESFVSRVAVGTHRGLRSTDYSAASSGAEDISRQRSMFARSPCWRHFPSCEPNRHRTRQALKLLIQKCVANQSGSERRTRIAAAQGDSLVDFALQFVRNTGRGR